MRMVSRFALSISKLYSSHFYCSNFQDNSDYNNLKGETTNEPNENGEEVGQSEDEHQYCKLAIAKPEAKKVLMNKEIKTEKQGQRKGPGAFEEYDGEGEDVGGKTEGEQATEDCEVDIIIIIIIVTTIQMHLTPASSSSKSTP